MKRSRWRRPSPALLVACAALFVALGGTVLAATKIDGRTIRVKSLPGNRLAVGSLPGNRLQAGTIPGSRLAKNSVRGDQIDVGTLGQVPNAAHADSADTARRAQTAVAADHAADASTVNGRSVGCGTEQREFAGACWDMRSSAAAITATEGAVACASRGGELPQALAFAAFARQSGVVIVAPGEWSSDIGTLGSKGQYTLVYVIPGGAIEGAAPETALHYRCVTPLLD
jgi:hypothetical protein